MAEQYLERRLGAHHRLRQQNPRGESEVDPNLPTLELVSNLGQNIATEEAALGTTRVVQGFTTGHHLYGYTLPDI